MSCLASNCWILNASNQNTKLDYDHQSNKIVENFDIQCNDITQFGDSWY